MKSIFLLLGLAFFNLSIYAQVGINTDNADPDASAMLDVKSTNKGLLIPRMTTSQRTTISNPANGLLVFDSTTGSFWFFNTAWAELKSDDAIEIADADNDTKVQVEKAADEDKIRFAVAGTEAMTIDNNGRVGIGTTNPSRKFEVLTAEDEFGLFHTNGAVLLGTKVNSSNGGEIGTYNSLPFHLVSAGTRAVTLETNGSVGIGTTIPPGRRLTVENSAFSNIGLSHISDANYSVELVTKAGPSTTAIGSKTNHPFRLITNDSVRMTVETTGNIDIGAGNIAMSGSWLSDDGENEGIRIAPNGNVDIGTGNISLLGSWLTNNGDNGIRVNDDGSVGINIAASRAALDIGSSLEVHYNGSECRYGINANTGGCTSVSQSGYHPTSIYADYRVTGLYFVAHSDERIKTINGISNSSTDLNLLSQIEVTDYTMKDTVQHGDKTFKKVIAQQVAEVYPLAVSTSIAEVPDIYQSAKIMNGWVKLATDLKEGEKVAVYAENKKELYNVLEIAEDAFRIDLKENGEVFVFGRQVDDFHHVDYEAIAMLNVSATQELYKQVQSLQKENVTLQKKLDQIEKLEFIYFGNCYQIRKVISIY